MSKILVLGRTMTWRNGVAMAKLQKLVEKKEDVTLFWSKEAFC